MREGIQAGLEQAFAALFLFDNLISRNDRACT